MTTIEIWSDFACPFCYAGEAQLDNAIAELGISDKVKVEYKAFELDHKKDDYASNPIEEVFMNKFHMSREAAERQVRHEQQMVRNMGLVCDYENARPSNTRNAHRLMKLAEAVYDEATLRKLNAALFNAYFVRRKSLDDREVLTRCGEGAGIRKEDITDVLNSNRYVEEVEADEHRAETYGITGVPYFLIDGRMAVPGCISTNEFKTLLQRIIADKEEPLHEMHAYRCTEEGCEVPLR